MKTLLIVSFFILFTVFIDCEKTDAPQINNYRKALEIIKKSEEYSSISRNEEGYYVSEELVPFYSMGWSFKKELFSYLEANEQDFIEGFDEEIGKEEKLVELSSQKKSKVKIYFSAIKGNIFFAEVLSSSKWKVKYKDRPHFGQSFVFMFELKGSSVELLNIKNVSYY